MLLNINRSALAALLLRLRLPTSSSEKLSDADDGKSDVATHFLVQSQEALGSSHPSRLSSSIEAVQNQNHVTTADPETAFSPSKKRKWKVQEKVDLGILTNNNGGDSSGGENKILHADTTTTTRGLRGENGSFVDSMNGKKPVTHRITKKKTKGKAHVDVGLLGKNHKPKPPSSSSKGDKESPPPTPPPVPLPGGGDCTEQFGQCDTKTTSTPETSGCCTLNGIQMLCDSAKQCNVCNPNGAQCGKYVGPYLTEVCCTDGWNCGDGVCCKYNRFETCYEKTTSTPKTSGCCKLNGIQMLCDSAKQCNVCNPNGAQCGKYVGPYLTEVCCTDGWNCGDGVCCKYNRFETCYEKTTSTPKTSGCCKLNGIQMLCDSAKQCNVCNPNGAQCGNNVPPYFTEVCCTDKYYCYDGVCSVSLY